MMNRTQMDPIIACVHPYHITQDQLYIYHIIEFWLQGLVGIVMGFVGIIFNVTTIIIVLRSELAAMFFNWLLICLVFFDSVFLLTAIMEGFRNHFVENSSMLVYQFVAFLYPLRSVAMCCSIYVTMLLALERYYALANPAECAQQNVLGKQKKKLKIYFMIHWKRLMKCVGSIIVLSSVLYIPKFMELRMVKENICPANSTLNSSCTHKYTVRHSDLRENETYIVWYLGIQILLTVIVPLISLVYLNISVFRRLRKHTNMKNVLKTEEQSPIQWPSNNVQQQDDIREAAIMSLGKTTIERRELNISQQTIMLFAIVVLFLISHTFRVVLNIEELATLEKFKMEKKHGCTWLQYWTLVLVPISHLLLQINCSVNLFIYCMFNTMFRKAVKSELIHVLAIVRHMFHR